MYIKYRQCSLQNSELNYSPSVFTRLGQCKYQHGDCVEILTKDTEDKLSDSCVGLPHCGITVSVAWMSRCRAYSSYNYALYKCIPSKSKNLSFFSSSN